MMPETVFVRRDPPKALPVDADEYATLREVRAIEVAWRVRASARHEHHGRGTNMPDRIPGRHAPVRELLQVELTKTRRR